MAKQQDVPAYLEGEATLDWGRIERLEPYAPNTVAPVATNSCGTFFWLR